MSWATVLVVAHCTASGLAEGPAPQKVAFDFQRIGPPPFARPTITNVQIVDLDNDASPDVVACDAQTQAVYCYRRGADGQWEEQLLGDELIAPAHATVVDLDKDGDNDVLVSVMGNLRPDDGVVGSLVLLENQNGKFVKKTLLDDVRRVVDAQVGDFDGDGDLDIAVAVFGYLRGQVLWLENLGNGTFLDHELLSAAGTIHVPVADYDRDGDLDIAAVVSQNDEEVWGFENLGGGKFRPRRLWMTINYDIGSAGLVETDLDGDGDIDLLLPVGDNLEDSNSLPQPYHGCLWLENRGNWKFEPHRIATFPGTYAAAAGDLDRDGDQDVVLCSMVNDWDSPEAASLVWLENDGKQSFTQHTITNDPIMLVTLACGDLNADGRPDIVGGGLHVFGPNERLGRVSGWLSGNGATNSQPDPTDAPSKANHPDPSMPPLANLRWLDPFTRADLEGLYKWLSAKVSDHSDTAEDWGILGQAYFAYGLAPDGAPCFEMAVRRNPKLFQANYLCGINLQRVGKMREAIEQFQLALPGADEEQKGWLWYEIGRCYLRLEDAEKAEAAFIKSGSCYASLYELAKLRIRGTKAQEGMATLNELSRLQPKTIELYLLAARGAETLGDETFADDVRDRAEYNAKMFPLDPVRSFVNTIRAKYGAGLLSNRAEQFSKDKNWSEAAAVMEKLTNGRGEYPDLLGLAKIEMQRNKPERAIELLTRLTKEFGAYPQTMLLLGEAYLAADEPEKAVEQWQAAARVGRDPKAHEHLADYYEKLGDTANANKHRALQSQETGIGQLRSATFAAAQKTLEAAVQIDAALPSAWFYLGECRRLSGDAAGTREAYRKTLELRPNHGRAREALEKVAR